MRYLASHQLAFIHIPKNGGQSVRNALEAVAPISYDALAQDLGTEEVAARAAVESGFEHPRLGPIHPAHITLAALRRDFPACWQVLMTADSFALTREPRDRFISAVMQRTREFKDGHAMRASDPAIAQEAEEVAATLTENPTVWSREYIHFVRQIDFVELNGQRIVDAVFPVDAADAIATWVQSRTGLALNITRDHVRRQPKPWARAVMPVARFAGRTLMPAKVKRAVYGAWVKSAVFDNAGQSYQSVDLGSDVERFIQSHYEADAALHAQSMNQAAAASTG